MKNCSPSLDIKEIQIKPTLRFHLALRRTVIIENMTKNEVFVRMWGKRNPHTLLVGMHASATTLEKNGGFLKI
jgi:hypothetical protein